ncbi:MAG: hypothetical protein GX558_12080 [Clostridiales bacterium]|nr:hypothetical protein [Clostridiales bacterium]
MKFTYDRSRVAEAAALREDWYAGRPVERVPFTFSVPCEGSRAWNGNPATMREMCENPDKAVLGQLSAMRHQFDTFPDCDYLPLFQVYHLGEGILASMYGAEQQIEDDVPPFTRGRYMRSIDDIARLPDRPDTEGSEWGRILRVQIERFLDATDGDIPVGVADFQSPYGTATKLMPNEALMLAMYDEPEAVHRLLGIITTGICDLIDAMRRWSGGRLALNANNPTPGSGLILWDDYVSVITPALHTEFCAPVNRYLYQRFGRGHLHTCGPYFPGYIDACLACEPKSLDATIMRGMAKTWADLKEFRRITRERGILLFGSIEGQADRSIFDASKARPTREMYREFMDGGFFMSAGGTKEQGEEFAALCRALSAELLAEGKRI